MSQPRLITAGTTYLITRRALRRHLLFRPDSAITQLIIYTLAVSARRYGMRVHALCAMSTHMHLVVTDVYGVLPRFLQYFHRHVALGTKVLRGWEGAVWDREATSVVRLATREAVVEKIAYTLANPVAAGLVRRAREWPGATVCIHDLGRGALRAKRPESYFDPVNPNWPDEVTFPLTLPLNIEATDVNAFRRDVARELKRQEAQARDEVNRQGRRFLGAARASAISPYERATSFEALRGCNPTFAVGRGREGVKARVVAAIRAFRTAYRVALGRWCAGERGVRFPAGTWWMHVFHGVQVDDVVLAIC